MTTTHSRADARTYITQPGESVAGIALRQCGSEDEWHNIIALNPEFSEHTACDYFPVGTVLTLPPLPVSQSTASPEPCAHDYVRKDLVCTECGETTTAANETGAEGAAGLAHELWTAAQLAPGEGIEDGVRRIEAIVSRSPAMAAAAPADERAAFVKLIGYDRPDTEGVAQDAWDSQRATWLEALEYARAAASPAAETVAQVDEDDSGLFVEILYGENGSSLKCGDKLYGAPQPAQADARVGLTDGARLKQRVTIGSTVFEKGVEVKYVLEALDR